MQNEAIFRKVTFTCLHLMHGGVERAIVSLANALSEVGFEVEILCTYRLGEPAYPLNEAVKLTYLTEDRPNREEFHAAVRAKNLLGILREGLRAFGTLYRKKQTMRRAIARVTQGAIVSTRHEHTLLLSRYGRAGVKKIAQLHNDHAFDPRLMRQMRRGYSNIDVLVLLTEQARGEVEDFLKGYNERMRCVCIPNFIEEPEEICACEKKRELLAAGRLHPDKNYFSLLRIWRGLAGRHTAWRLKIAGTGPQEDALKAYAKELGIEDSVEFAGALPHRQLLAEMETASAFALTSVSESFGLVLVEAMSRGTVPVAYDVRVGPRAILEDGKTGFLVPEGEEEVFGARVERLMEDGALRDTMAQAAREAAKAYYKPRVLRLWSGLLLETADVREEGR